MKKRKELDRIEGAEVRTESSDGEKEKIEVKTGSETKKKSQGKEAERKTYGNTGRRQREMEG